MTEPMVQEVSVQSNQESLVARLLVQLDQAKSTRKVAREALDDELMNDTNYATLHQTCKDNNKLKKSAKDQVLLANQHASNLATQIEEVSEDIKMIEESLTAHAMQLYRDKGLTEILDENGNNRVLKMKLSVAPIQLPLL